jgi:hypothetical protein
MSKIFFIIAVTAALTSCASQHIVSDNAEQASWSAFCATHGYNTNTTNQNILDQYLDTWVGSTEEEKALTNIITNIK